MSYNKKGPVLVSKPSKLTKELGKQPAGRPLAKPADGKAAEQQRDIVPQSPPRSNVVQWHPQEHTWSDSLVAAPRISRASYASSSVPQRFEHGDNMSQLSTTAGGSPGTHMAGEGFPLNEKSQWTMGGPTVLYERSDQKEKVADGGWKKGGSDRFKLQAWQAPPRQKKAPDPEQHEHDKALCSALSPRSDGRAGVPGKGAASKPLLSAFTDRSIRLRDQEQTAVHFQTHPAVRSSPADRQSWAAAPQRKGKHEFEMPPAGASQHQINMSLTPSKEAMHVHPMHQMIEPGPSRQVRGQDSASVKQSMRSSQPPERAAEAIREEEVTLARSFGRRARPEARSPRQEAAGSGAAGAFDREAARRACGSQTGGCSVVNLPRRAAPHQDPPPTHGPESPIMASPRMTSHKGEFLSTTSLHRRGRGQAAAAVKGGESPGMLHWDPESANRAKSCPPQSPRRDPISHQGMEPPRTSRGRARSPQPTGATEQSFFINHVDDVFRSSCDAHKEMRLRSEKPFAKLCAETEQMKHQQLQEHGSIRQKNGNFQSGNMRSVLAWG